jgi:serine/threonine-protein kinase RIO1
VIVPLQALDPRTRMVLFKMLNRGLFSDINGCISTGKEANVYHAVDAAGNDLAVKIYKTSILVFKDRDRLVARLMVPCSKAYFGDTMRCHLIHFHCLSAHRVM